MMGYSIIFHPIPSFAAGRLTNRTKSMLNLGSYNYLGFADDWGATCKKGVMPVLDDLPVGCSINRRDFGKSLGEKIQ